jgi:hypothetical protein
LDANTPEGFGPPPFRFLPAGGQVRGAAYSVFFKVLATALVFSAAAWLANLWTSGQLKDGSSLATWFLAAMAMMLYTWWSIVRSVTSIDGTELRQTWIWTKKLELRELAYARLIRVRGLEWLIAPRLYARTLLGKFNVFYAADPAVVAEFERLVGELTEFRSVR